jgi:hypothetical protein
MIFHRVCAWVATKMDRLFGVERSHWMQIPMWGCLTCMASLWTLALSPVFSVGLVDIPITMLIVCGINALINKIMYRYECQGR